MIIGVPKEIKDQEYRIAIVPSGVKELVAHGHTVLIEEGAGNGAGIDDSSFRRVGAEIVHRAADVWGRADMVMKVKEPLASEWPLIRESHILFTYFHFASGRELTDAMIRHKAVCIAYETVQGPNRSHPLLTPMSEIAGRLSVQQGAKYQEKVNGGRGTLLGGVPGVKPARVLVIGGGVVGSNAARISAGMGADTIIFDKDLDRLRYLDDIMPANVTTLYSSELNIIEQLDRADVVIGGVYISGARAPHLIRRDYLKLMPRGAVMVDVAIDQGGCFETSRPTTHSHPIYEEEGIIHYCVTNMPGAVARTSTFALTNATLPFALKLADQGWMEAMRRNEGLKAGLNIASGLVYHPGVAEAHGMKAHPIDELLD